MTDDKYIDVVPVTSLHERLHFTDPISASYGHKPFSQWKMEEDDAPILRYLYRQVRPSRHLEFGTWEGTGACYCLEECGAHVWTINLPHGEMVNGQPAYFSSADDVPEGACPVERNGVTAYQTDAGAFIGHRYRAAGFEPRVTQIYQDSRDWDPLAYGPASFDTVLIDGGHTEDVVLSDTRKALVAARPGGLILWHDFCPDPAVFTTMSSVVGVVGSLTREWAGIASQLQDAFWIQPSFLLVGVR